MTTPPTPAATTTTMCARRRRPLEEAVGSGSCGLLGRLQIRRETSLVVLSVGTRGKTQAC